MKVIGEKSRVKQQHRMGNLKALATPLAKGAVVEVKDYNVSDQEYVDAEGNDQVRMADWLDITVDGTDLRLAVSEFTKYAIKGENPLYRTESDKVAFPKSFTIDSATPRVLNTDASVVLYPIGSYTAEARKKLNANEITWVDMVSDPKNISADNRFAAIQDYVIVTEF